MIFMRTLWGLAAFFWMGGLMGCVETTGLDYEPPAVPRGLISITGDGKITLVWVPNEESDLAGYNVWYSDTERGGYELIASTSAAQYVDRDVENGRTYYYAVSAFDFDGNESALSPEIVHDTPRPEGRNVTLWDYRRRPERAGFHFSSWGEVVAYDDERTDMYFDYDADTGIGYMIAPETDPPTQMQDDGYTESLEDVNWAPEEGWSPSGVLELIEGHSYIVWTWDNFFAAFRVTEVGDGFVVFDWCYQTDQGNPELKIVP